MDPIIVRQLEHEGDPVRRLAIIEKTRPPEPQLLDTCVLQNLDWVDRLLDSAGSVLWDEAAIIGLEMRYGRELATDLIDLGTLYKQFEHRSGYPWLVCSTAVEEAMRLTGHKGERLRELIAFFAGHQDDWTDDAYPSITRGLLLSPAPARVSPLLLRGLGVTSREEVYSPGGPLSFLPDQGDRMIAAHALTANVPVVLTTDRATFWKHRHSLTPLRLQVMCPADLLRLYEPYWELLDAEFERRRAPGA